jgi:hypothetical protein
MCRLFGAWVLSLMFVTPSYSQMPAGKARLTDWLVTFEAGSDPGYKLPSVDLGVSFERPVTKRFELQGGASYSPTASMQTNDGHRLDLDGELIFWIARRFGPTASLGRGYLWTSQYTLGGWSPSIGFVVRDYTLGSPGRFYFSYLIPTGCQWGAGCRIQSSRRTGPKIYWEHRIAAHWRVGFELGVYRVLDEGNPLDPAAGRASQVTGDSHFVSRFDFPGGSPDEEY